MTSSRQKYKPGPGWKHLSGGVYEHSSGIRLHMLGVVRLPNGEFHNKNTCPNDMPASKLITINGDNRKRGLMTWALTFNTEKTND